MTPKKIAMAAFAAAMGLGLNAQAQAPTTQESPASTDNQFEQVRAQPPKAKTPANQDGRRPMQVSGEFGKGITWSTPSDDFSVLLRGRAQLQGFSKLDSRAGQDPQLSAQVRRLRVLLGGHAFNRELTYYIQLGFGARDLENQKQVPLRDAFLTWHMAPSANLRVGQMKVPFDRQRLFSSSALQLVERSSIVNELNLDRDVGAQLYGELLGGHARYFGGIFNGDGRNLLNEGSGLLYVAKLQYLPFGEFKDSKLSDVKRAHVARLVLSGAGAYNHQSRRSRGSQGDLVEEARADLGMWTADAMFQYAGFSLMAEYLSRRALNAESESISEREAKQRFRPGDGYFVQTGWMLSEQWEVAGRAGRFVPTLPAADVQAYTELVLGLNWFKAGDAFKLQSDYSAVLYEGWTEHQARIQAQLFF